METNRLKQFRTIVETGNLRRASHLLGISHSGLSKSMKALEAELGFPLFLPSGRGIIISDEGKRFFDRSHIFIKELEFLLGAKPQSNIKFIRLGSFEVFTTYFMGHALKEYLPDLGIEIHELVPGRLEEALIMNKIDLGVTYEPIPRKGIEYIKIKSITMGAFKRNDHFKELKSHEIPFVVPVNPLESAPSGVRGLDGWPDESFKRNIKFRVDLMTTGLELVKQGLCAIFIPEFVASMFNDSILSKFHIAGIELPKNMPKVKRDVYLVKRDSSPENSIMKQIAKAIRNLT